MDEQTEWYEVRYLNVDGGDLKIWEREYFETREDADRFARKYDGEVTPMGVAAE